MWKTDDRCFVPDLPVENNGNIRKASTFPLIPKIRVELAEVGAMEMGSVSPKSSLLLSKCTETTMGSFQKCPSNGGASRWEHGTGPIPRRSGRWDEAGVRLREKTGTGLERLPPPFLGISASPSVEGSN
jgi:hypothetical protein